MARLNYFWNEMQAFFSQTNLFREETSGKHLHFAEIAVVLSILLLFWSLSRNVLQVFLPTLAVP